MRWMWIDRIIELVPRERLVAIKHVSLAEEHLHDHFEADAARGLPPAPVMPGSLILEGMAQTAGILVGHAGGFREKVILAKIGKADLEGDALPGHTLRYTATLTHLDAAGAAASGQVDLLEPVRAGQAPAERAIGRIELMFSHVDQNMAGLEFPEHNFVFSESFATLLRVSGVDDAGLHTR